MSSTVEEFPHRAFHWAGWFVAGGSQAAGAPIIDTARVQFVEGWHGAAFAIRLPRTPGWALMVGRLDWRAPAIHTWGRRRWVGWLFRPRPGRVRIGRGGGLF